MFPTNAIHDQSDACRRNVEFSGEHSNVIAVGVSRTNMADVVFGEFGATVPRAASVAFDRDWRWWHVTTFRPHIAHVVQMASEE